MPDRANPMKHNRKHQLEGGFKGKKKENTFKLVSVVVAV
jgi:hypothetical protein